MEMNSENWNLDGSLPNMENEMKQLRKNLRRRNRKIIITSLVLAAVLLLAVVYVLMPIAEGFYWSPETNSYNAYDTDFSMTLQAYTELFQPGKVTTVQYGRSGFATYALSIHRYDFVRKENEYLSGTLERGNLILDRAYNTLLSSSLFRLAVYEDEIPEAAVAADEARTRESLSQLPEYVTVEAAITFPADKTIAEMNQFNMAYNRNNTEYPLKIIWIGIRNSPRDAERSYRLCGMAPYSSAGLGGGINEYYPEFNIETLDHTGEAYEQHFKSLLQYSSDQLEQGTGMKIWYEGNYYDAVLDYVEENGIMCYGCIVTATPQALLSLLDSGEVIEVNLMDGWISIP